MRTLRPILNKPSYSKPIQKAIYQYLYSLIFAPVFDILKEKPTRHNAVGQALLDALRSGVITYEESSFRGKLNANISRQLRELGATYNKRTKAWSLEIAKIPDDVKFAIIEGNQKNNAQIKKIEDFLKAVESRDIQPLNLEKFLDYPLNDLQNQYDRTTRPFTGADIAIPLREDLKEKLKVEYQENLNLYIKKWHDEEILKLRVMVQKNVSAGYRASNLVSMIQHEKGVTFRKAEFLARNETSLLTSKYRQIRYEEAGIQYYMWSTSKDDRVRKLHRELDGKIFRFDQPPVIDIHTMTRGNPGEFYNCRCVSIAVIKDVQLLQGQYVEK